MASASDVVFLDACVILDGLINDPERNKYVEPILLDAEKGNIIIVACVLAITEVYHLGQLNDSEAARTTIDAFFNKEFVEVWHVDDKIARKAADFRRGTKLKTPDAIHLATAVVRGAHYLITRDGENKKRSSSKTILSLANKFRDTIKIMTPKEYTDLLSSELKQAELPLRVESELSNAEEDQEAGPA